MTQPDFGDLTSPFVDPKSWDTIKVQSVPWYGKFEIRRAKRKYKWDVKNAKGIEGATQTYAGKRPEVFSIEFFIWTDFMWTQWKAFSLFFQYKGIVGLVDPVQIDHPSLAAVGITSVVCDDLGILEKRSDDQMWSVIVMMREFFPALLINATDTPAGALASTPAGSPGVVSNPAYAALQAKVAALHAQAEALGTPGGLPL